jgi:alkaline phosphatase
MRTSNIHSLRIAPALFLLAAVLLTSCRSHHYDNSRIFAHNDYARDTPFYTAYDLGVGYIEADVFLIDDEILVAHHRNEIEAGKTLDSLYLKSLQQKIAGNKGFAYPDHDKHLTLMIDLKTEGAPTLKAITQAIDRYPALIASPTLHFMISGSVPDPLEWNDYPEYIYFDGRPDITYTAAQLERISMISTSFTSQVKWDGEGSIQEEDQKKLLTLAKAAHQKGKKMRFWATPDSENAWRELMKMNMDVIVTDKVTDAADFLKK